MHPLSLLWVAVLVLSSAGCRRHVVDREPEQKPRPAPVPVRHLAAPGSFVKVLDHLKSSVVHLRAHAEVKGGPADWFPTGLGQSGLADDLNTDLHRSLGVGFIVDTEGTVVTHAHLVAGDRAIQALLPSGATAKTRVIGRDEETQVAVLKLELPAGERVTPARLGDSDQLRVGEWVVAVGNPFGHGLSASAGVVSAPRQDLPLGRAGFLGLIQTDASIHPGNSGGPLVSTVGEVVGMCTMLSHDTSGIGYAVPLRVIRGLLPLLKRDGRVVRAWVGLRGDQVTGPIAKRAGLATPTGVVITEVVASGPAQRAGLRVGDVVLGFDQDDVTTPGDLAWRVLAAGVGRTLSLTVWRGGKRVTVPVQTERMPE